MPQTMFAKPICRVSIADSRQRRYDVLDGDQGFFIFDRLAALAKEGKLFSTTFAANTLSQFGAREVTQLVPVDRKRLQGVLPRPVLRQPILWTRADGTPTRRWGVATSTGAPDWPDAAGTVHNDFWDFLVFSPNDQSYWDFVLAEDGLLYEFVQKTAYVNDGTSLSDWGISQVGFDGTELLYDDGSPSGIAQGLSPNPFFTAGFRRQAIPPEFLTAIAAEPSNWEYASTQIVWGMNPESFPDGKWMLYVPLTGKPVLYERMLATYPWGSQTAAYWWPRQWTEGDLSEIKAARAAKEGYTYHIGHMGHAVCVSEGGFDGDGGFAYYLAENSNEPICPYGSMLIRNWPGQCTFWLDFNVFAQGRLERWPVYVPAFRLADMADVIIGQPFSAALATGTEPFPEIIDELPGVNGMGVLLQPTWMNEVMGVDTLANYTIEVCAGTYPAGADPAAEVVSQTPPFVEAVQWYQNADLTDNGAPTFTETGQGVIDLSMKSQLEDTTAGLHELTLVNAQELYLPPDAEPEPEGGWSPTKDFQVGRQIQLTHVGWRVRDLTTHLLSSQTQNLGNYWVIAPRRGPRQASFGVTDLLGLVGLNRWDGETDLNFRDWLIRDAIAFGLELQGLGPEQYALEDTGLTVPNDENQNYRRGTSWLKIFQGLVDRGGAIWYDYATSKIATGCRYCRTARTSGDVLAHADAGWASSGCLAADVARAGAEGVDFEAVIRPTGAAGPYPTYPVVGKPTVEQVALNDAEFANEIVVVGSRPSIARPTKHKGGVAWESPSIIGRWRNQASLDWQYAAVDHPELIEEYIGYPIVHVEKDDSLTTEQEVWRRVAELAGRMGTRPKKLTFSVPLMVSIQAGQVVRPEGGDFGQVDGLKLRVTAVRHNPGNGQTEVEAREMVGIVAE